MMKEFSRKAQTLCQTMTESMQNDQDDDTAGLENESPTNSILANILNDLNILEELSPADKETNGNLIRNLIQTFPSSLSHVNHEGHLPIHVAAWCPNSCQYVCLLAEEGLKYTVGGEGNRGGVLLAVEDPQLNNRQQNVLQSIANLKCNEDDNENQNDEDNTFLNTHDNESAKCDSMYLNTMQDLRQLDLLKKEDISDYELIYWSCHPEAHLRFNYLVTWDTHALKCCRYNGESSLIHAIIANPRREISSFAMALKAQFQHYPDLILKFLFQKDKDGMAACKRAFHRYGIEETISVIEEYISSETSLPILHYAIRDTPGHFKDFALRYPSAMKTRDKMGRSILQFAIASGSNIYSNDISFFARNISYHELEELDPIAGFYPFITAAIGSISNLSTVHYLLRRNPSLLLKHT